MNPIPLSIIISRIEHYIAMNNGNSNCKIVFGRREIIEVLKNNAVFNKKQLMGFDVELGNFNYGFIIKSK